MMKQILMFLIGFSFFFNTTLLSQTQEEEGDWTAYIAEWEEGPGSILVRMDLIDKAPFERFPVLLVTGLEYKADPEDGLPAIEIYDELDEKCEKIVGAVESLGESIYIGTFTHLGKKKQYFYIKSKEGVEEKINKFYKEKYPEEKTILYFKSDEKSEAYTTFLYPNEETQHYLEDQAVVVQLIQAGDDLTKSRRTDHWVYFKEKSQLEAYVVEIKKVGFKVEGISKIDDKDFPHKLQIWRDDFVDLSRIYGVTSEVRLTAKKFDGFYDGWETFFVSVEKNKK